MMKQQLFRIRYVWWVTLTLGALLLSACSAPYELRGGPLNPPREAPNVTLTDHNGQPFDLSAQRGKVVLLFFGFTSCPDVCPSTLADIATVKRELGADADKLQVAMITVDPETDTPEQLAAYLAKFDPTFIGLRGEAEELNRVYKAYGVTAIHKEAHATTEAHGSGHNDAVIHSDYIYVIDTAGRWREVFQTGDSVADITSDMRYLVRERL